MLVDTLWLIGELTILFFGVTFLVQVFQRRMGTDRVRRWLGGPPLVAALKGILIGFLTPFCTFTAIPMLVGLRRAGVPPAGYVAFIVAAPVLDPVLFGALIIIVGLDAAALYLAVAFVAAISLAMVAEIVDIEHRLKPVAIDALAPTTESGCDRGQTGGTPAPDRWRGWRTEAPPAARAAVSLLRTMAPLLLAGVVLSIVIDVAVPPGVTERVTTASPTFAIPIAAALGTPLYVSTAVFVPIADSLTAAGVGIGAIVALTIAGAGANLPEFVILSKLAHARIIAVFVGYVFGVAIVGGLLAEALVA